MKNTRHDRIALRTAIALLLAAAAQPVLAQQAPDAGFEEIVVTATKRAEKLQDIPFSIAAIGGDTLSQAHVVQADELVTKIPNLQLTSTVGDNTPIFALRGVSMSDYSLNQASPVATYYDEVYKGNFALLGVAMYDLERVEVLRGPQGTLYGKNTTGGAVNLISRSAKLGASDGYVNVGYGNYNRFDASGAKNFAISDTVAARVAFTYSKADGWFENVVPGKKDLAGVDEYGVRASVLWEPNDGMKWVLRASTSLQTPTNYGIYAEPAAEVRAGLGTRQIAANIDKTRYARTQSVALTGAIDVGSNLMLTSITSYDKGVLDFYEDTDGQSNQLLEVPYYDNASQVAQDLRLTSDFTGPFNFILGAYFNRESVFNRSAFEIGKDIDSDGLPGVTDADCAIGLPLGCIFQNEFSQKKKSFAVYADASYQLSDALTLRGGLRFTDDKGEQTGFRSDALGPNRVLVVTLIPPTSLSYKKTNISGKIGLDYKLADDRLLYANFSRGYRANSFNAQAFFDPSEVSVAKPETVDAFEVGIKSQWADRRVTLNAAAFTYKYTNQQFLNIDPTTAAQTLLNLPESSITGAEVELTARASDAITLRAGLGLLDAKVKKGIVSGVDVKDHSLSNAPKMTFNGGVDADVWQDTSGSLSAHVDLAYSSSQYFEVINVPRLQQGSYTLLNAHLDWESADGKWTAAVWGKNLADKFYHTSRVDLLAGFGFDYNHIGAPRTFGISAGMKF